MPDPPSESLITRFLLENPLPLTVALVAGGLALAWWALREGRRQMLLGAGGLVAAAVVVLGVGRLIVTPGEQR